MGTLARRCCLFIVAVLGVVSLSAVPAQATDSPVIEVDGSVRGFFFWDCARWSGTTRVWGQIGDTFTLNYVNCFWFSASPNYYPGGVVEGDPFISPTTLTIGADGFVFWLKTPTRGSVYLILIHEDPPTPDPAPVVNGSAQEPLGQGLPVPASGDCRDINERDAVWARDLKGGWTIGWTTWRRDDGTIFHDGFSCNRVIEYRDDLWQVRTPDPDARYVL